jgi:Zn-dependent protease with chaperone function
VDTAERARRYHRWQFWLGALSFSLAITYLTTLLVTGAAQALRDRLAALTPRWWLQLPLALVVFGVPYRLITFPITWLAGFWLPRRFGLLHQPFLKWLWDSAKGALIGALLGLIGAEIVYALLRATAWWWLWSAAAFFAGYALLAWVTPIWLVPLFYRLTPLADGDLRDRLLRLAAEAGVPVTGVWVADQSRKSRTANAAVIGLGSTRRIILFDTLAQEFRPAEIEVVLAHELAHQVHRDIARGLFIQAVLTLATFRVVDLCLRAGGRQFGLLGPSDLAGLPLFGLILMGVGLLVLPLANGWSRHVERSADEFALRVSGKPTAFIGAMERLADLNLAERDPHPIKEFFLYSHPSIARRISRAQQLLRSPA